MRVFVEPLAWDPSKGAWPIAQLDVHVTSYLKDREVNGARAVSEAQKPCASLYFIQMLNIDLMCAQG